MNKRSTLARLLRFFSEELADKADDRIQSRAARKFSKRTPLSKTKFKKQPKGGPLLEQEVPMSQLDEADFDLRFQKEDLFGPTKAKADMKTKGSHFDDDDWNDLFNQDAFSDKLYGK
jgi:hypothetical protein